jgi:signal transduction histidine kinase/ligand-binding sensor domain-containing protein/DNA-binding response OmpR family regulator
MTAFFHRIHRVRAGLLCLFLLPSTSLPLSSQDRLLPVIHFERISALPDDNIMHRPVRDQNGALWVSSANGLEKYDGYGCKVFRNIPGDSTSISSNVTSVLRFDSRKLLWVGSWHTGLSVFDPSREQFINYTPRAGDSTWLQAKSIYSILEDRHGTLWLGTSTGVVRMDLHPEAGDSGLDAMAQGIRFRSISLRTKDTEVSDICERSDGKLLVASVGGLFELDPATLSVSRPNLAGATGRRLDSVAIGCMYQEPDGTLWLGTYGQGLFRIDWKDSSVLNYRKNANSSLSIRSDEVSDIVGDRQGTLWIATPAGLDRFLPDRGHCDPYIAWGQTPQGTGISLSLDSTGTLWAGANAGGMFFVSPKSRRFPHYGIPGPNGWVVTYATVDRDRKGDYWFTTWDGKLLCMDPVSLEVHRTIDIFQGKKPDFQWPDPTLSFIDAQDELWYGTTGLGLYRINLAAGEVRNYRYASQFGNRSEIMSVVQGPGDTLWVSGGECGLLKFSPRSGKFESLRTVRTNTVMRARDGKMWVTTEHDGLMVIDPVTGKTDRYVHDPSNPHSLSGDRTRLTYEDASGRIWICATATINLWNPATRSFIRFSNPGLKGTKHIFPLGTDTRGRLWMRNIPGVLSILDPVTGTFTDFDASDGVCSGVNAMEVLGDGKLLLAGAGINVVDPDGLQPYRPAPALVITRMSINDTPTLPLPLAGSTGSMLLDHFRNVIELEFAAIDIDAPQLIQYRYKLEGLEEEWVRPENRRFVRYPGLRPGNYLFRVSAGSLRSEWPDQEIALAISITPPWWQSRLAYVAYAFILFSMLFAAYKLRLRQIQLTQQAEMDHFKAEHLAEVDSLRSRFFANISHEFRTPLTLISGPIDRMLIEEKDESKKQVLSMMKRNSKRLLRLINQLLDLAKLETGALKLRAARINIVPLVRGIACSFESSAGLRGISLEVLADQEEIEVYCDTDMLDKILTNLLSNAFKFTPDGGAVTVTVTEFRTQNLDLKIFNALPLAPSGFCVIEVSDTGIGIPEDQLGRIFDRFYQVDASHTREYEGSGIGLALAKELVDLHHGSIRVRSEVGQGTSFTVRLPLGRSQLGDDEIIEVRLGAESQLDEADVYDATIPVEEPLEAEIFEKAGGKRPIILIVEDNADVRAYVKGYLVSAYHVAEARDGEEGIARALELLPDLVISDVMMPKKDGYEVCRTLKRDEKSCHIPIILLTAKAAGENKIEGLEIGADDYLIKPFEPKELLARVKNLIDIRRKLRERFKASVPLRPGEIAVTSMDDAFLQRAKTVVEGRMSDEKFSVEEFAVELCMSRSQLHRKLTALTTLSAGDFLRYLRLHRAMELLISGSGTIAEVAFTVGFTDPSHFSRSFHRQFGASPSEFLKKSKATQGSHNSA